MGQRSGKALCWWEMGPLRLGSALCPLLKAVISANGSALDIQIAKRSVSIANLRSDGEQKGRTLRGERLRALRSGSGVGERRSPVRDRSTEHQLGGGDTASPRAPQPRTWGSPMRWHCWDSCRKKEFLCAFSSRSSTSFFVFFPLFGKRGVYIS